MVSRFGTEEKQVLSEEQFCQVIDAIINGKYSWACLLVLKFCGYNPLHYIPYRTYNRLMKEHGLVKSRGNQKHSRHSMPSIAVENLPHEESLGIQSDRVRGGIGARSSQLDLYFCCNTDLK